MSIYTTTGNVTITCHKRTMPYLEQEVKELGFEIEETFVTGVRLKGTINDCIRLNLNLRCASQVLYSLKAFTAVMRMKYTIISFHIPGKNYYLIPVIFPLPAM